MSKKPRLLCVDDEPELLEGIRLNLRKRFVVTTAASGAEALALFDDGGSDDQPPFDVVLSDMRMPQMSGAELLTELRTRYPDVPRLLLSGQSDLDSAIAAINDAKIFRFLTKPCPPELLIESLEEAVEQARLRTVERDLLDNTLSGTVSMLTEVLGLVSAGAYSRTMRIRATVRGICEGLDRPLPWDLDLATMLSQIGVVVMPSDDDEAATEPGSQHPELAAGLLANIPRLETVASMIGRQVQPDPVRRDHDLADWSDAELNTEILRVAVAYDRFVAGGCSHPAAHQAIRDADDPPIPTIVTALASVRVDAEARVELSVTVDRLAAGMVLDADVFQTDGPKLAGAGTPLTSALIGRIRAFAASAGVIEPIDVLAPAAQIPAVRPPRRPAA